MRSYHFVPAHNRRFLERIPDLAADRFVLELEDGVGTADKDQARANAAEFLSSAEAGRYLVRVNAVDSTHWAADLEMLRGLKNLPVIVLPKVENAGTVQEVVKSLSPTSGEGQVQIISLAESFSGLENLREVAGLAEVIGLGLGMEDLLSSVSHDSSDLGTLVSGVKLKVVLAARAAGIQAIDTISTTIRDAEKFRAECEQSRSHGFHGRFTLHPSQVPIANEVYGPSAKLVAWAQEVMRLSGGDEECGYQSHEGRVISGPMVVKARAVIEYQKI